MRSERSYSGISRSNPLDQRLAGSLLWFFVDAPGRRATSQRINETRLEIPMMDTIATTTPVLAAGWSLLYMLFGGGLGGAVLIFFGLKALGR